MGEKVGAVLKLIEEDGDSFAKRAEMYYKKRPELINFVEESYRAYRSLAERYDHISKELQNANSTLASAFPDQFQFPIDDDDDEYSSPRMPRKFQQKPPNPNIPKAPPKFPTKNIKAIIALTTTKHKNAPKSVPKSGGNANKVPKSGLSKSEALDEIDKLQKRILTRQTEKEFAKSSYESGYAKYWNIEEDITGMQEKISKLQDEFRITQVIEDDEARTLMAEAALKSCQDTLAELQEKQEKAAAEAKAERQKIKDASDRLKSIKGQFHPESGGSFKDEQNWTSFDDVAEAESLRESKDLEMLRNKIKKHFDVGAITSLSVSEMAEKIDELVNKVIDLETAVSSQTALIHRLRSETDKIQSQIESLEDDKANLIAGKTTLSDKLGEMENKLKGLQDLNHSFENKNSSLKTHFTEARSNLDIISKKLHDVKPDKEVEEPSKFHESRGPTATVEVKKEVVQGKKENDTSTLSLTREGGVREGETAQLGLKTESQIPFKTEDTGPNASDSTLNVGQPKEQSNKKEEDPVNPQETQQQKPATLPREEPVTPQEAQQRESVSMRKNEANALPSSVQPQGERQKEGEEPNWRQLFTNGLEGKEKVLLEEYTSTLRNYKEAKKRLSELEKKSQHDFSEIEKQLKELKISIAIKDDEIHSLRQKLGVLQKRLDKYTNSKEEKNVEPAARNEEPSPPSEDDDDDIKVIAINEEQEISPVEEKLRADIDEILEENLDFWMRFSASFSQIQKFQNIVQDLHEELAKLEKDHEKKEGSSHGTHKNSSLKSVVRPTYKHQFSSSKVPRRGGKHATRE